MAIEIPHEVALFLNYAGVPYPDINEDQVRQLAAHVKEFAAKVRESHEGATGVVENMGTVWSGYSYQQMITVWARMSATHMADLDRACEVVSKALYVAAEVIEVTKVAVLAELAALASMYLAALAGTFATGGLSAVATQAIPMIARKLLSVMEQVLIAYILAEVLGKAIEPLAHLIERMIGGSLHDMVADVLDLPPPPSTSSAQPMRIDPDEVLRYADTLDAYADQMLSHAKDFADKVSGLDFTTPGGRDLDESRNNRLPEPRENAVGAPGVGPAPRMSGGAPVDLSTVRPPAIQSPPISPSAPTVSGPPPGSKTPLPSAPPSTLGSSSPVHEMNPRSTGPSTGTAPSGNSSGGNPAATRSDVTAPPSNSAVPKANSVPWGDGGGTRRDPVAGQSGQPAVGDSATPLPRMPSELPGVAAPSGSGGSISAGAGSTPFAGEHISRTVDLGVEPIVHSTVAPEAAVSGGDTAAAGSPGVPASGPSSPWSGGRARRSRAERAKRIRRRETTTEPTASNAGEPGPAETRQRIASTTPWAKTGRETGRAAKVFAPETASPAAPVPIPYPARKRPVRDSRPPTAQVEANDGTSERREDR